MNPDEYPVDFDPLDLDEVEEEMGEEDWENSDYLAVFQQYLLDSKYWNPDRTLDMPTPGTWLNGLARGVSPMPRVWLKGIALGKYPIPRLWLTESVLRFFRGESPALGDYEEAGSPGVHNAPDGKSRRYPMRKSGYRTPEKERTYSSFLEPGKVEDPYFDSESFEVPDFDLWPGQNDLYG